MRKHCSAPLPTSALPRLGYGGAARAQSPVSCAPPGSYPAARLAHAAAASQHHAPCITLCAAGPQALKVLPQQGEKSRSTARDYPRRAHLRDRRRARHPLEPHKQSRKLNKLSIFFIMICGNFLQNKKLNDRCATRDSNRTCSTPARRGTHAAQQIPWSQRPARNFPNRACTPSHSAHRHCRSPTPLRWEDRLKGEDSSPTDHQPSPTLTNKTTTPTNAPQPDSNRPKPPTKYIRTRPALWLYIKHTRTEL